ncbi:MAG: AAA family ATPase [Alphaproteobacteria bacterium]|uniref:AAA family ATPase n=1 Tax=Aestuariivirga sp. TaxID=2650926 RepID=UPI003017B87B|nr:AAA family ATPase [Alphaproteobacteria bacterium]
MRIAVSGSHSLGKSTVVNDWITAHPEFSREEEPYRALSLHGPYEIRFRDESTRLHNGIQLYYNISRIHRYASQADRVIFDRSPIDYIAYSQYTADQGTTDIDQSFVETMIPAVRESLDHLDLVAFVPRSDEWPIILENDGIRPVDEAYRDAVDDIFKQIYRHGRYGLFPRRDGPRVIELLGPPQQRIAQIEEAILHIGE